MNEVWLPCVGYEQYYEVSNLGNVRSVERMLMNGHKNGLRKVPSKILKPGKSKSGYLLVTFCVDKVKTNQNVHRLVAKTFIENKYNKPQVNHKDGDKMNNCLNNLEWVTVSENTKHAYSVLNVYHHKRNLKQQALIQSFQSESAALRSEIAELKAAVEALRPK